MSAPDARSATVRRLVAAHDTGCRWGLSVIVKIMSPSDNHDETFRRGTLDPFAEVEVYRSGLVRRLTDSLRTPTMLAVDTVGPQVWLWLADVADELDTAWDEAAAVRAIGAVADLHAAALRDRSADGV